MTTPNLADQLRTLRLADRFAEARKLIHSHPGFAKEAGLRRLAHEHEDFWWQPIVGRRVTLQRRGPGDVAFVRACWGDADFMRKFNRVARPLPADDKELRGILARERAGLFSEAKSLHWTLFVAGEPIGFISVTDFTPGHRRAEFLIGLLRKPASSVPVEAAHLAVRFLEDKAGLERLTAYFYAENEYAAKVAQKFGFQPEGLLKGYIRDADGGRSDLLVSGMPLGRFADPEVRKIRDRVVRGGPPVPAGPGSGTPA